MRGNTSASATTVAVTAMLVVAALLAGCSFGQTEHAKSELPSNDRVRASVNAIDAVSGTINSTSTAWTAPREYRATVDFSTSDTYVEPFVPWPAVDNIKVYVGQTPAFYVDENGDPITEWNVSMIAHYRSSAPQVFQSLQKARMGERIDPGLPVPVVPESAEAQPGPTYLGRDTVSGRDAYAVRINADRKGVVNRTVWYDAQWYVPVQWYTNTTASGMNATYQQSWHRLENASFTPNANEN